MRYAGDYKRRRLLAQRLHCHLHHTGNLTGPLVPFVVEKASSSSLPNVGKTGVIGVRRTIPFQKFIDNNFGQMVSDRGVVLRIGPKLTVVPLDAQFLKTTTVEEMWKAFKEADEACYIVYYEKGLGDLEQSLEADAAEGEGGGQAQETLT